MSYHSLSTQRAHSNINLPVDFIISHLVPLRERGKYMAIMILIFSIGSTLVPFIGGAIVQSGMWRWVFWLNLPVGGISIFILFFALHVQHQHDVAWASRLRRIDFIGNGLLIAASTVILLPLSYAGTRYPWHSWHTLVPLLIGIATFFAFSIFEAISWAPGNPVIPPRLFGNPTSIILGINSFLNSCLIYWGLYLLPVYFQTVKLASPSRAGINLIPLSLLAIPSAIAGGLLLTPYGRYKPIHLVGFATLILGRGLYTALNRDITVPQWVAYELFAGIGPGC
ncbi:major facilitator superfamily domain-containing protein [Xylariaceae sp. FL0804]|nr:major facilitator superfamily domain-containing protein [Xylariaceae sp. FL0804]